jgi:hypothetical protein
MAGILYETASCWTPLKPRDSMCSSRPIVHHRDGLDAGGRNALRHIATIVTPNTILRWHRQGIVRKGGLDVAGVVTFYSAETATATMVATADARARSESTSCNAHRLARVAISRTGTVKRPLTPMASVAAASTILRGMTPHAA